MNKALNARAVSNIAKVVRYMSVHDQTYLRQIARDLKMNPNTVHRTLAAMQDFIVSMDIKEQYSDGADALPNMPVFLSLRKGTSMSRIMRAIQVKESLKG